MYHRERMEVMSISKSKSRHYCDKLRGPISENHFQNTGSFLIIAFANIKHLQHNCNCTVPTIQSLVK